MQAGDPFLNPRCLPSRLFDYKLRRDIRDALTAQLPHFSGTLLDVGCGDKPYKPLLTGAPSKITAYIGLDVAHGVHSETSPDVTFDGINIPLADKAVDCAMATEVFEHCAEPEKLMREIARVLKPSGFFFLTVPFFWPVHEAPYDHYRYTPFALRRLLELSGFEQVEIKSHGGWDASLAQMIGLWIRFRHRRAVVRHVLSWLCLPIVWLLNKLDTKPANPGYESVMSTGFSVSARKRS